MSFEGGFVSNVKLLLQRQQETVNSPCRCLQMLADAPPLAEYNIGRKRFACGRRAASCFY